MRETLNTSAAGFLHEAHDRTTFDDSDEERHAFYEKMWNSPGFSKLTSHYTDLLFDEAANARVVRLHRRQDPRPSSTTPRPRRSSIPKDHRFGEHRPPFVTGYFEAFNRPNVALVDLTATPILRVTATGIETADGLRELDVIVWATGFDFGTGALSRMGIRGRDGLALTDHWADGPTHLPRCADHRLPQLLLPRWAPRRRREQPPLQRRPGRLRHRDAGVRARPRPRHDRGRRPRPRSAGPTWSTGAPSASRRSATSSYYFGTNIPGKPRKYLLNSAGRPKLFKEIDRVRDHRLRGVPPVALVLDRRDRRDRGADDRPAAAAAAR